MDKKDARIEALYRRSSERLISDSSLRDSLDDAQARELLDWGLEQMRASAEKAGEMPEAEAEAFMESELQRVRRVMRRANGLMETSSGGGEGMYLAVLQFVEELQELDKPTVQLQNLKTLEKWAVKGGELQRPVVFSQLMELLRPKREE